MSIINRLIRSIKSRINKHRLYKAMNRKGRVDKHVDLLVFGRLLYGDNVRISSIGSEPYIGSRIAVLKDASLSLGNNIGMTQVSILCKKEITIEDNVKIGAGSKIIDSNFHNLDWKIRRNHQEDLNTAINLPVHIENDVFIGTRCLICKGVTIGARSVIAAGSVVVKDIPSDCIAGGNPCKVIKQM